MFQAYALTDVCLLHTSAVLCLWISIVCEIPGKAQTITQKKVDDHKAEIAKNKRKIQELEGQLSKASSGKEDTKERQTLLR